MFMKLRERVHSPLGQPGMNTITASPWLLQTILFLQRLRAKSFWEETASASINLLVCALDLVSKALQIYQGQEQPWSKYLQQGQQTPILCTGTDVQMYCFCLLSNSQVNSRQKDRHNMKDICCVPAGQLHTHTQSQPDAARGIGILGMCCCQCCQQDSHKDSQHCRMSHTFNAPISITAWGSASPLGSACTHSLQVSLAGVPIPSQTNLHVVQRDSLWKFSHLLIVSRVDVHSAILSFKLWKSEIYYFIFNKRYRTEPNITFTRLFHSLRSYITSDILSPTTFQT